MITREKFIKGDFKTRNNNKEKHPVFLFLLKNKKNAYTVKEISKYTKVKQETVRTALRGLVKSKKIIHKIPYFIAK